MDNNGSLITSGTLIVEGSWDNSAAAVFTQSSGQVIFAGTMNETIASNGDAFIDVHINDGLIGYWRLDESSSPAEDFSGYSHDGRWNGTPSAVTATSGTIDFANDRALDFNANTDYVLIQNSQALANLSEFTLSAWINVDGNPGTGWGRIIHKSDGVTSDDYA